MEWRRASCIDFYKTGVMLSEKGLGADSWGDPFGNCIRVEGSRLAEILSALDIPFEGKRWEDAKGRKRTSYPDLNIIVGNNYDGEWEVEKLWVHIYGPQLVNVRAQYPGGESEEFTFSGEFVVWWADTDTPKA